MARIPYADQTLPANAVLAERITEQRGGVLHLYAMLLHSPPVTDGWLSLLTAIRQKCILPSSIRELVILQVAHLNGASYEAEQHLPIALKNGLSREQVDALPDWRNSDLFSPLQRASLNYCDASTRHVHVEPQVFEELRGYFDHRLIVELTVTIAAYNMVSRVIEALAIESADSMETEQ